MLAISVDPPERAKELASDLALPFDVLSDADRTTIARYGLEHAHAGPGGADIAIPAQFLVRRDGTIAWRHVSTRVTDRADPEDTIAAIRALAAESPVAAAAP